MPYYLCDMVVDPSGIPDSGPDGSGRLPRVAVVLGLNHCDAVSCRDLEWCVARTVTPIAATADILPLVSDRTLAQLTPAQRTAMTDFFDRYSVPRDWITPDMTPAFIGRWLTRYIGAFYRITDNGGISIRAGLAQTFQSLSEERRLRIKDWFGRYGVALADLRDSDTLETIIATIVRQYRLRVALGGEDL